MVKRDEHGNGWEKCNICATDFIWEQIVFSAGDDSSYEFYSKYQTNCPNCNYDIRTPVRVRHHLTLGIEARLSSKGLELNFGDVADKVIECFHESVQSKTLREQLYQMVEDSVSITFRQLTYVDEYNKQVMKGTLGSMAIDSHSDEVQGHIIKMIEESWPKE